MNFKSIIENLKNYISMNKKIVIISVLLALILTILTPHLWVKTNYWKNHYTLTFPNDINAIVSVNSNFISKALNKNSLPYLTTNKSINNKVYISKKENNIQNLTYQLRFCPNSNWHNFNNYVIKANSSLPITIVLPDKVEFKSFNINNKNCLNKFTNNSYTIYPQKNETLTIDFNAKAQTDKSINLIKNISFLALLITFIVFSVIINLFIRYDVIKKVLLTPKYPLIFLFFFMFYMYNNHYAVFNTNYIQTWDIFWGGDTPSSIESIMYSISRVKHSFFFLPFYPIFDILFILTKNLTLSLIIVFSAISALNVSCLFKLIDMILPNSKNLNLLLTLIFGFSYTLTTIYYSFEIYPITGLYLILLIILLITEFKSKEYNYKNMFFIILVIALSYGVTTSNIFTSMIILSGILLYKKDKKSILIFCLSLFLLMSGFKIFQSLTSSRNAWTSARIMTSKHLKWFKPNKNYYIHQVIKSPMLAQDTTLAKIFTKFFWGIFILLNIFSLIILLKNKNITKDERVFIITMIALLYNLIAHYYWFPKEGLLFSQNHFALWFVNIAYCISFIEKELQKRGLTLNNALTAMLLLIFLGIELPNNYIASHNYQYEIMQEYPLVYPVLEVNK